MSSGRNSVWRKPMGTGKGSLAQTFGMESPDLETAQLSAADQAREDNFIGQIEGDIAGNKNSLAIAQYKQAQEDAIKGSMALNSSVKGVSNPALLARNVSASGDGQAQALAQDSSMLKLQERQQALGQMNSYLTGKQNIAASNTNAQNAANAASADRNAQMWSGIGAAAVKSDGDAKKNIKPSKGDANKKIEEFLESLESYNFEYKDKSDGQGEKTGVMAQDLEKSELGKQMVNNTPDGKMVDFGQGFAAILAAQAELKDEIDSMKKKKA